MSLTKSEKRELDVFMGKLEAPNYELGLIPDPVKESDGTISNKDDIDAVKLDNLKTRVNWIKRSLITYFREMEPNMQFPLKGEYDPEKIIRVCADMCVDELDIAVFTQIRQLAIAHESVTQAFTSLGLSARDWSTSQTAIQKQKQLNRAIANLQASESYKTDSVAGKQRQLDELVKRNSVPDDPIVQILSITAIDLPKRTRRNIAVQRQTDPEAASKAAELAVEMQRQVAVRVMKKARADGRVFDISDFKAPKYKGEETT